MSVIVEEHSQTSFTVNFDNSHQILTTVTASGADVESWVSGVLHIHHGRLQNLVVGLDVEWRPNRARNQDNPVAVLQLCVGLRCLIFQILHADYVPAALGGFLADTRFCFVGVGIQEDVDRLVEERGLSVPEVLDLRRFAAEKTGRREMLQMGLAGLAAELMGVRVAKPNSVRMSRWDQCWLSDHQIGYACVDAFLSFEIGRRLFAGEF